MLTLSQVTKSFGGRILFEEAALQVNTGDRIGLIGPNGAGKSTLFSLLLRNDEPDEGLVTMQRGVRVGFLPQETAAVTDQTVMELAAGAEADGRSEAMAKRILSGLAFRETDFHRPVGELSGGWIMRAHLARLLVEEPDLLLLDEPTNHLDLETLGWFQNHLAGYPGAILTISHDREFLNLICRNIVEIRHRKLIRYTGNFDACLELKKAREEQQLAAYRNQQKEIAHLEDFINRFRAKASKAAQAQDRIKQLGRMVRIEAPESDEPTVSFRFPQPPRGGQKVITLQGVRQAYGNNVIYDDLSLEIEKGHRTVLVGPNGAGKSTLLKILAGQLELEAGTRTPGHNCSIGYFAQHRTDALDVKRTVLEEVQSIARPVPEQAARTVLGAFLFRGDDVFKRVSVLSGGEKSRLALVKLLLDPPNFLLLDEPTTHLDMPASMRLYERFSPMMVRFTLSVTMCTLFAPWRHRSSMCSPAASPVTRGITSITGRSPKWVGERVLEPSPLWGTSSLPLRLSPTSRLPSWGLRKCEHSVVPRRMHARPQPVSAAPSSSVFLLWRMKFINWKPRSGS
jgi:ATP-binding cassette subfamily F protein 3